MMFVFVICMNVIVNYKIIQVNKTISISYRKKHEQCDGKEENIIISTFAYELMKKKKKKSKWRKNRDSLRESQVNSKQSFHF